MAVDNGCCELLNDIYGHTPSLTTITVIRLSQSNLLKLFIFYDAVHLLYIGISSEPTRLKKSKRGNERRENGKERMKKLDS